MADLKAFAEQLVNLTVKEVNELATILKEEYGIEPAAAAVAVAAGPAAGGDGGLADRGAATPSGPQAGPGGRRPGVVADSRGAGWRGRGAGRPAHLDRAAPRHYG